MSLKTYLQEAYDTDKIAIEEAYESLMSQEEAQHRERMDAYAEMRKAAMQRLTEKYGEGFEQPAV